MLGDGLAAAGWGKVGPSHRQARGENIPVLLKVCYSAANSIPKVLAVSVVIFVLLVDWLDLSGTDWSVMR